LDADVERDVTVLVKTFERPDALRRLIASIRRFYPSIPVVVVDDGREALDPVPEGVTRYWHEPFNSLGLAGGRNLGLRRVETDYVLVCDDDMVFGARTDLGRMLQVLETTSFGLVSCRWMDHDPWKGTRKGFNCFEGTLEQVEGALVHNLGATRGISDGLPVFDIVHNFFLVSRAVLGVDPWDSSLNFREHTDFFLTLKDRGVLCTRIPDVVVYHHPQLPDEYREIREYEAAYFERFRQKRGFERREFRGRQFRKRDRIVYELPSAARYTTRRVGRAARRLVREGRLRAGVTSLVVLAALVGGPAALAATITIGKGLGPWKLGQHYAKRPGLLRTERRPRNDGPGCVAGPPTASRIDYYRTLRLAWRGTGASRAVYLIDIATTRRGDHTPDGFVIGRSRLRGVRRAHPNGHLSHPPDRFRLGRSLVTVVRSTGTESWVSMLYWFDRNETLVALETSASGC
jgi:GT2 family glycosyltransferase